MIRFQSLFSNKGKLNSLLVFILVLPLFFSSCRPSAERLGDFRILPSLQQYEIKGISKLKYDDVKSYYSVDGVGLPVTGELLQGIKPVKRPVTADIVLGLDASMDIAPEGYILEISKKQIRITGKDKAGLFYGLATLEQLMEDAKDEDVNLPVCHIEDYPLLAYRAVHLDMKHHREKKEYYYKLIDRLAKYKINAIIAEMEDKIKYVRQPEVGSDDALTIEEWKDLSDYAWERNIEISPLVQGLGHASFILKHEQYKDLRDDPESDWAFNPLDPRTYKVQFDLYLDAIEATPHGKYLHVGGDEVHTTGRNSGKSSLELQLIWLDKVSKFAEEHGRIPIFWDDMPLKNAGVYRSMFDRKLTKEQVDSIWAKNEHNLTKFIDMFPKNCIYMRWNYSTPELYGNLKAMDWFISHGFKVIGATAAQTRWVLMPQNESNIKSIRSFALSSIKSHLNGLLLTLWDDDSPHFELYWRGILAFAEYTWAGDKRDIREFKTAFRQRMFGYPVSGEKYAFIDKLEVPVRYWKDILVKKGQRRNNLVSMKDAEKNGIIDLPDPEHPGQWTEKYLSRVERAKKMLKICDTISVTIDEVKEKALRNIYTLEVYEQVNDLVEFTYGAVVTLANYDDPLEGMTREEALEELKELPGRFSDVRAHFEEVYSKTRILTKPENYILDQDHHRHSANQTISFDWQFIGEILFLDKLEKMIEKN